MALSSLNKMTSFDGRGSASSIAILVGVAVGFLLLDLRRSTLVGLTGTSFLGGRRGKSLKELIVGILLGLDGLAGGGASSTTCGRGRRGTRLDGFHGGHLVLLGRRDVMVLIDVGVIVVAASIVVYVADGRTVVGSGDGSSGASVVFLGTTALGAHGARRGGRTRGGTSNSRGEAAKVIDAVFLLEVLEDGLGPALPIFFFFFFGPRKGESLTSCFC